MRVPKFAPQQAVSVKATFPPGHVRTPYFTRGRTGTIDSAVGFDPNPENMAYGIVDEPAVPLYRVRFRQRDLWSDYTGNARDTVVVDIFEHWLEAADER